ncbi:MAG: hypothetical protein DRP64_19990 [Verrucomicrobia bacterium]|nr:MAG: hypothetical protein DRP64_19990 [Verrucomicrobiota bacterium]
MATIAIVAMYFIYYLFQFLRVYEALLWVAIFGLEIISFFLAGFQIQKRLLIRSFQCMEP